MYNPRQDIEKYLNQSIEPLKFSLWFHHCEREEALCLYSDHPKFKTYEERSPYDIEPLLRNLVMMKETLSKTTSQNIFRNSREDLCYLLRWTDVERLFLIFDLSKLTNFDEDLFAQKLPEIKNIIGEVFQKALYQYQDEE